MVIKATARQIIAAIYKGDPDSGQELYRRLYQAFFEKTVAQAASREQAKALFTDAFIAFLERIRQRKLVLPEGLGDEAEWRMVERSFERRLHREVYHFENSVYRVIAGVKNEQPEAAGQLLAFLRKSYFLNYARYQMEQFEIRAMEASDFLEEAILDFLEKIRKSEFELLPDDSNEQNKNRVIKYFRRTIFNKVSKWKRQRGREVRAQANERFEEGEWMQAPDMQTGKEDIIQFKMLQLITQLGPPCASILRKTYSFRQTPKMIASSNFHPDYQTTEQVRLKKNDCLQKLHRDLIHQMSDMDSFSIERITSVSQFVIENMDEPCRTILKNYFSPVKKTMDEIVKAVQQALPGEEASKLRTADQVKKRKYKCMLPMYDQLWNTVFSKSQIK